MVSGSWASAACGIVLALSGCSGSTGGEADDPTDAVLQGFLEQAIDSGASDRQIELLREARDGDGLTYENLVELNAAVIDCLEDGGLEAFVVTPIEVVPGLLEPQFGVRPPEGEGEDEALSVVVTCFYEHFAWAQQFYESQETSVELQVEAFERAKPDTLACLAAHGTVVDLDAPNEEIYQAVGRDVEEHGQQPDFEPCYRGVLSTVP